VQERAAQHGEVPAGADHPVLWRAPGVKRRRVQREQHPDQGGGRTELVLGEPPGRKAEGAGVMRLDDQGVHRAADAGRIVGDGLKRLGVTSARLVSGPGAV
jgi:hypothetical protein